DAGRAKRLRSDGVFFPFQQQTANNKTGPDDEPDRHPQLRRYQVVLKRIFYEKRDAEEKREAADPREQFRAHELLPIDRWFGCFGELRRLRCKELLWDWRRLRRCFGYGNCRYRFWNGFRSWFRRRRRCLRLRSRNRLRLQLAQFVFER